LQNIRDIVQNIYVTLKILAKFIFTKVNRSCGQGYGLWRTDNSLRLAQFSIPRDGKWRFEHIDFRLHGRKIASACSSFPSVVDGKWPHVCLLFRPPRTENSAWHSQRSSGWSSDDTCVCTGCTCTR